MVDFRVPELTIMEAIIGSLFTAIITLWAVVYKYMESTKKALDKCNEAHDKANCKIVEMTERLGKLEGENKAINTLLDKLINANHLNRGTSNESNSSGIN